MGLCHMNTKMVARLGMMGCLLLVASNSLPAEALNRLSGSQIRARLAGMELTDKVHWREAYLRDGSFVSRSMGRVRTGKWRVENDELCVELADRSESGCYEVWLTGTKVELRPPGVGSVVDGVLEKPVDRNAR
jgi:hypothetical protein